MRQYLILTSGNEMTLVTAANPSEAVAVGLGGSGAELYIVYELPALAEVASVQSFQSTQSGGGERP